MPSLAPCRPSLRCPRALRAGFLLASLAAAGCAVDSADPSEGGSSPGGKADDGRSARIAFGADWSEALTGELVAGSDVIIDYAEERVACTGTSHGNPAWTLTLYARMNGAETTATTVLGHETYPGARKDRITLPEAGALELWFENNSAFGCHAWDSNLGANYKFEVRGRGVAPAFLGEATVVFARQTCDGAPCDADRRPAEDGFLFDSWVRERAAFHDFAFDVEKDGVTDFDNPDLWRTLDVKLHHRFDGDAPYEAEPVDFLVRRGTRARYAFDLAALDPFAGPAPTAAAECPEVPFVRTDAGAVRAALEYYVTVNDHPLRADGGKPFKGVFEAEAAQFSACLPAP